MRLRLVLLSTLLLTALTFACGPKPDAKTGDDKVPSEQTEEEKEEAVQEAKAQIGDWFGKEVGDKIKVLGSELGKDLAKKVSDNGEVKSATDKLVKGIFEDPNVKPRLDKITDEAIGGAGKKISLGIKAMASGGPAAYKRKIKEIAQKAAVAEIADYIKTHSDDERLAEVLKGFAGAISLPAKVSAAALHDNLSSRVTKKILAIAIKIAAATNRKEIAAKVEDWIMGCEDVTKKEVERLLRGIGRLESFEKAAVGLATDVFGHETTRREISGLAVALMNDSEIEPLIVQVYEDVAFNKGEGQIRNDIKNLLSKPKVEEELYGTLNRLVTAKGAGLIMATHAEVIGVDPRLADLIEEFVLNVIETCGDPEL